MAKKYVHKYDIPQNFIENLSNINNIAIDTETTGLNLFRDRLCLVQICIERIISKDNKDELTEQEIHIIHFPEPYYEASNLKNLLSRNEIKKIFHFARFDMGFIYMFLNVLMQNVVCTKILSKIARTYTDRHSLVELCKELLDVNLNKSCQSSDWGAAELSQGQIDYAAKDVIYLSAIYNKLNQLSIREGKEKICFAMFLTLPHIVFTEIFGYDVTALLNFA